MIKNTLYKSFVEKAHFQQNIKTANNWNYSDTLPLATNTWTFNDVERSLHSNAGTGSYTYIRMKIGKLYSGDLIKTQADFQNISGVKAKISMDFYDTQEKFDTSYWEREKMIETQSTNTNVYQVTSLSLPVHKDGWYDIVFGLYTNDVGEFKMRSLLAKIETIADAISSVRTS